MKRTIKIYGQGNAYLGQQAKEQGYDGTTDAYFNYATVSIVKPGCTLKEVKRSLEITLQDIELRMTAGEE